MNQPTDHERLLADVLAEAEPAGFREVTLEETLRLARGRRRGRQTRRAAVALAVLGLAAALAWLDLRRRPVSIHPPVAGCKIIRTLPLPAGAVVATQPFSPDRLVASIATVERIQTTASSGGFSVIDDAQLLALIAPRPAVLIGVGPQQEALVFVNPEDRKGFPVN
jgi:hypothetical protein